jgi:hypothetical protein
MLISAFQPNRTWRTTHSPSLATLPTICSPNRQAASPIRKVGTLPMDQPTLLRLLLSVPPYEVLNALCTEHVCLSGCPNQQLKVPMKIGTEIILPEFVEQAKGFEKIPSVSIAVLVHSCPDCPRLMNDLAEIRYRKSPCRTAQHR